MKHSFRSRNGMAAALILAMLAVISILFYGLAALLKQEAHVAGRYSRISVLANIAEAACAIGLNELDAQLADHHSKLFMALYGVDAKGITIPKLSQETGEKLDFGPDDYPLLKELIGSYSPMFPGLKASINIEIKYIRQFDPLPSVRSNPVEKLGLAEITAKAWIPSQNMSQTVREKREIKMTCHALPVVSRFTFFLRSAFRPEGMNKNISLRMPEGNLENPCVSLNRIQVNENGSPPAEGFPVIVRNSNGGQTGWVFLGAGGNADHKKKPILITVAGGAQETGEDHHLFRVNAPPPASCYINKNAGNNGHGLRHESSSDEAAYYEAGFSDDLVSSQSEAILGLNSVVAQYCLEKPSGQADHCGGPGGGVKAHSSVFHFFDSPGGNGTAGGVMLGNVYRAYAALGVYRCVKEGGNFKRAGFLRFMGHAEHCELWEGTGGTASGDPHSGHSMGGGHAGHAMPPPDPADHSQHWAGAKDGEPAPNPPDGSVFIPQWKNPDLQYAMWSFGLGPEYSKYQAVMSDIRYDTYIHSAYPVPLTGGVPEAVEKIFEPTTKNCYNSMIPADDRTFTNNVVKGYVDFTGDLNGMKFTAKYFNDRRTVLVKKGEQKEFWNGVISRGTLDLKKVVVFEDDVEIPAISDIECGGMIVGRKNVKIKKIELRDRKSLRDGRNIDDKNRLARSALTIASTGGKIIIEGNPVCAHLVSLCDAGGSVAGSLSLADPQRTVDIFGRIAVNSIDLEDFSGLRKNRDGLPMIEYNPILYPDPGQREKAGYLTNEFAYCVNMMPTVQEWAVTSE